MKVRKLIITAGALLALAGPAAQTAGAQILNDRGSRPKAVALKEMKAELQHSQQKASATAIHVGAYNVWAYAYGGVSAKVGKAITKAGKHGPKVVKPAKATAPSQTAYPKPPAGSGVIDHSLCLLDNVCTPQELCDIWGLGCLALEQPLPGEVSGPTTELAPADGSSDGSGGSTSTPDSGASATVPPADLVYDDC
jgi:hypothetical protein